MPGGSQVGRYPFGTKMGRNDYLQFYIDPSSSFTGMQWQLRGIASETDSGTLTFRALDAGS